MWACDRCTCLSSGASLFCEACDAPRRWSPVVDLAAGAADAADEFSDSVLYDPIPSPVNTAASLMQWSCLICRSQFPCGVSACPDCTQEFEAMLPDDEPELVSPMKRSFSSGQEAIDSQLEDTANRTSEIIENLRECYLASFDTSVDASGAPKKRRQVSAARAPDRTILLCREGVVHMSQRGGLELGSGWACGYRNIQMLCSSLLAVPAFAPLLFGGARFVPEISFIQAWIERAWKHGYDVEGGATFDNVLLGGTEWIGTTECAAMLRSFGIPAMIKSFQSTAGAEAVKGALMAWVWEYFAGTGIDAIPGTVTVTPAFPLYLQHDGHSRLIIGIEERPRTTTASGAASRGRGKGRGRPRKQQATEPGTATATLLSGWLQGAKPVQFKSTAVAASGDVIAIDDSSDDDMAWEAMHGFGYDSGIGDGDDDAFVSPPIAASAPASAASASATASYVMTSGDHERVLIMLDPAVLHYSLANALLTLTGWERFVKRGLHTLVKPEYQVVAIASDKLMTPAEAEAAKSMAWQPPNPWK